ncbi:monooxygenase [Lineolata rhizophorae]|uniref:Monooxygenase n=1 Tax=Lineolata rhizophorae TaxID=578093 RepID=A0A6A6P0R6_9PEZI|nr:monooxygenase [Lineolata rhizophorae]
MAAMHVLVVGAGITGLLIAQGLKKNGIACTVFESEPSATHYRSREWGMSVQWGLPLLADCLPADLFARVHEAANDPNFEPPDPGVLPTLNGATGELLKNVPLLRMYRVSRRRFRTFCAQGIDVQYGKQFKDVSYSDDGVTVAVAFEDGTSATGTLLVGADGAQSLVRTSIFGPDEARAQPAPYSALNLHVCYGDTEKALFVRQCHPIMTMGIHPDGYWLWISIQDVPDPTDPATWTFQLQTTWRRRDGEMPADVASLANQKARAATFGEPFRSANLWIPEGTKLYANSMSYWEPRPWDTKGGRVLLAGDAAHPMTFQRGQGMNHGIADATSLVKKLTAAAKASETSAAAAAAAADAVAAYMAEMVDRAGDEVRTSWENTQMLHDWKRMAESPIMQRGGNPREEKEKGKKEEER